MLSNTQLTEAPASSSSATDCLGADSPPSVALVSVREARKRFGTFEAVDGVSFDVPRGSFTTLLGASGSGKTTMLRLIAGLEKLDGGSIAMDSSIVASSQPAVHVPPERRRVGFVFQNFALWPHMTVFKQVAYPLKVRRQRAGLHDRVSRALELVGLSHLAARYPSELSGGQQQRVSVARALVYEPTVLLLDEPLSSLDAELRDYMRFELQSLHRRLGMTMIYVTHDQAEALSLSDQVIVMERGQVVEIGTPRSIYERPERVDSARFVGGSTILAGTIADLADAAATVRLDCGVEIVVDRAGVSGDVVDGDRVTIAIKPEDVVIGGDDSSRTDSPVDAVVTGVAYVGSHCDITLELGSDRVRARSARDRVIAVGDTVAITVRPDAVRVFRR